MYSAKTLEDIRRNLFEITPRYTDLLLHYSQRKYRSVRGKEFATQGFSRRMGTLKRCIENVFEYIPPDFMGVPSETALADSTIALQAFLFNVFGCLDNLAWIWVEETGLKKPDGSPLPLNWIGIGPKYATVRASFTPEFRTFLETRKEWFSQLEGYRNALAHRIPPYIPPCCVDPANADRFKELDQLIFDAALTGNALDKAAYVAEQEALKFFKPYMAHSFQEESPIGVIHPQMIADFLTVEEFAWRMREQLDQLDYSGTTI